MTSQEPLPRVVVRSTDVSSPVSSEASIPSDDVPAAPSSDASDAPSSAAQDAGRETPSGVVRGGAGNPGESSGPDGASEPAAVYARSLARTQLRLAVACVVSFLAVVTLLTVTMSAVPTLGDVHLWGVPLPWLLHAYGFYPVIGAFALVFALAAARNERRFRALVDDE